MAEECSEGVRSRQKEISGIFCWCVGCAPHEVQSIGVPTGETCDRI